MTLWQKTAHPRLFLTSGGWDLIRRNATTPVGRALADRIKYDAKNLLSTPVLAGPEKPQIDLGLVRRVYWRITTLVFAYVLTNDAAFARRAIAEMLDMAQKPDWHPAHYLDTAELTTCMGLGYDWLYDQMSAAERELICNAICDKALRVAFAENHHWIDGYNNWVQVCHTGMVIGALAVAESEPELAAQTIQRALTYMPKIMKKSYYPVGAYPEGPVYWGYGTDYNSLLIDVLESCCGQSFGLAELPGFSTTGAYEIAMLAPDGRFFNYSDCWPFIETYLSVVYLAKRFQHPEYFNAVFAREFAAYCAIREPDPAYNHCDRQSPFILLHADGLPATPATNTPRSYSSTNASLTPVTAFVSDWQAAGAYLGVKGGSPGSSHGHMDGGSFIYLADGVRWALEPGMPDYGLAGVVTLWELIQQSSRYQVAAIGRNLHNILVLDDQDLHVAGRGEILQFDGARQLAEYDLSSLYGLKPEQVRRKYELLPDASAQISDFLSVAPGTQVRWQLVTDAKVEWRDGAAILHKNGKSLRVAADCAPHWVLTDANKFVTVPGDKLTIANLQQLSFVQTVPASGQIEWQIKLELI